MRTGSFVVDEVIGHGSPQLHLILILLLLTPVMIWLTIVTMRLVRYFGDLILFSCPSVGLSSVTYGFEGPTLTSSKASLRNSVRSSTSSRFSLRTDADGNIMPLTTYRVGSISQDTSLCLWDITTDILHSHLNRNRANSHILSSRTAALEINTSVTNYSSLSSTKTSSTNPGTGSAPNLPSLPSPSQPSMGNGIKAKRNFSLSHKDRNSVRSHSMAAQLMKTSIEQARLLGTQYCPRLDDVPLLEPLTCKKLAHNMLTSIHFYRDYLVVSCQDGVVSCFARPNKQVSIILLLACRFGQNY